MISVEKFGYDCGGSLRVVYEDGAEDWLFTPFRDDDLRTFHILGGSQILAVGALSIKLFDTDKRVCTGQKKFSDRFVNQFKVFGKSDGTHIIAVTRTSKETGRLTVYCGSNLSELLQIEDSFFSTVSPIFERHDGAIIVGGVKSEKENADYVIKHAVLVLTFSNGTVDTELLEGRRAPLEKSWVDPSGRKVAAFSHAVIPLAIENGVATYGMAFDIWSLDQLDVERTVVVDRLPLKLHEKYWGQDLRPVNDGCHAEWLEYARQFDPETWDDSAVMPDFAGLDKEARKKTFSVWKAKNEFKSGCVVDLRWDSGGNSFWVLFTAGYLRQVGADGVVSPRFVIERFATPPALGIQPHQEFQPQGRLMPREVFCMADGTVQVHGQCSGNKTLNGDVCFDPSVFFPDADSADLILVPKQADGYGLDSRAGEKPEDEMLVTRKSEFLLEEKETEVPLADLSSPICIAAINWLTEAIERDPYELVRGYWFRPTFVLAEGGSDEQRMGEDEFFAHVADNVPEAAPDIERLLLTWADKMPLKPKYQNYYMDEETVALSHALKALVTLEPCCYGTIRRYVAELDFGHDVIIQREVLPYFGQVNGWRDMDAIKLGLFCMFLQGRAGSPRGWIDPAMRTKVEQTMTGNVFAELLIGEAERSFPSPEVASSLKSCAWYNFREPKGFDHEAKAVVDAYLARS
jgi:hypothetical protein